MRGAMQTAGRKRVLIVNCYADDTRAAIGRAYKVPQAMGPAYLAGTLSPQLCDLRLYSELYSGPLEDERTLTWPDMLVLTGLTTALDRMRHVTAYARTKNPKVIVVAGGHAVRALPRYCQQFFDYCCLGDVEQLREVVSDAFGKSYAAEEIRPRFDLAPWLHNIGYLETSRYCNFRCSFCTLAAEDRRYSPYDIDAIRCHILSLGRRKYLAFIDNNFFGNDRQNFFARLDLIRTLWRGGHFQGWIALVTSDFFSDEDNLTRAREAGCVALFSGVESFDTDWLQRNNKPQNTHLQLLDLIRKTLEAGIVFLYGLVLDVTTRRLADIRRELDFIVSCPEITLPAYLSISIPILRTPFFYDCLRKGLLLPRTRVRDLDSTTLSFQPLDSVEEVAAFVRDLQTARGYHGRILAHTRRFARRYRSTLPWRSLGLALFNAALLCAPVWMNAPTAWRGISARRTYVSTTDVLDRVYTPAFAVDARYEGYFKPAFVTDQAGCLSEDTAADLCAA